MPVDLFSLNTAFALVAAAAFALLCRAGLSRALFVYALVAAIPTIEFVRLSGNNQTDALRAVEWLGTVLIGMWLVTSRGRPRLAARAMPINAALVLLLVVAAVSLVVNTGQNAAGVPQENVKLSVSLGQMALLVWPVGLFLVAQSTFDDWIWIARLRESMLVLALPMALFPWAFANGATAWVLWSVPFGLAASPMAAAELFEPRPAGRRLYLAVVAIIPIAVGIATGKAFWYICGLAGIAVIVWLKARRRALILLPLLAVIYVTGSYLVVGDPFPVVRDAVAHEFEEQSLGGRAGRVQLGRDAIQVWRDYPLLGVGPGNMWPHLHTFSALDTPHNQVLGLLVEFGVLGVTAFILFVVAAAREGLRLWRASAAPEARLFVLGWLGLFGGMVVGGVTGDVMLPSIRNGGLTTFSQAYLQWVIMGAVFALPRITGDRAAPGRSPHER